MKKGRFMPKKMVLGKGIASLIQSHSGPAVTSSTTVDLAANEESSANPCAVEISLIKKNNYQPRTTFGEDDLLELTDSIRENGIIQPVILRRAGKGFELIAGERRLRAAKKAGFKKVPAIVRNVTDREKLALAIIENVQRSDLSCIEEANAYLRLMDDFGLTQEEVAQKIGKERSTVANFLRILKLPARIIQLVAVGQISFGHAKVLAAVKDEKWMGVLASKIVEDALSVRALEKLIKEGNKKGQYKAPRKEGPFHSELDMIRQNLERKTGFHLEVSAKKNGSGKMSIKFHDHDELDRIYQHIMR